MLDLDAHLERIDLSGRPSLAEVHRSHVTAIPFESFDPYGRSNRARRGAELLAERFGLSGFALDADGHIVVE